MKKIAFKKLFFPIEMGILGLSINKTLHTLWNIRLGWVFVHLQGTIVLPIFFILLKIDSSPCENQNAFLLMN